MALEQTRQTQHWNQQRLKQLMDQTAEQDERVKVSDASLAAMHERASLVFAQRDAAFEAYKLLAKELALLRAALREAAPQLPLPPAPPESGKPPDPQASLPPRVMVHWPPAAFPDAPPSAAEPAQEAGPVEALALLSNFAATA
jgi:hypothetical protein